MASLVTRPDGKTVVYWYDAAGRRHGKLFQKDQRREARKYGASMDGERAKLPARKLDLESAAVYYLEDRRSVCAPATYQRYHSVLAQLIKTHGKRTISSIAPHDIAAWRDERGKTHAPATVRNDLKAVRQLFRWLVGRGWLPESPCAPVQSPKVKSKLPAYLTPKRVDELLATVKASPTDPAWYLIILFATRAGMRRNEILTLRWTDLDLEDKTISITGKSKEPRVIPMAAQIETALLDWPQDGPNVFPARYKVASNVRSPLIAKKINAWLRQHFGLTLHGLRHSFAVGLVTRGASERAVGDWIGHQDVRTVRRYARTYLDHLRQFADPPAPQESANPPSPSVASTSAEMETPAAPPPHPNPAPAPSPAADKAAAAGSPKAPTPEPQRRRADQRRRAP